MRETELGQHERELAAQLAAEVREYRLADWATSNLAVVLHAAGMLDPPAEEPERTIRRALLISSARILRLARGGMAVGSAGYEAEARVLDRAIFETRGRREQVLADPSGGLARKWLDGKLEGGIATSVRESLPVADPGVASQIYKDLSRDAHGHLDRFVAGLVRERPHGGYLIGFSPFRTNSSRKSLFLYAWLCGEASEHVSLRTGIQIPDHAKFAEAILGIAAGLQSDFGRGTVEDTDQPSP